MKERVTICGHSSGAHIAMLLIVHRIEGMMTSLQDISANVVVSSAKANHLFGFDSYVGISGPYDISHHFDYEAARGVEEFSPMKPVCGNTREAFRENSPALRLQAVLAKVKECEERYVLPFAPKFAFVHGIDDGTVPFTATAEAARIVRSCGLTECFEIYVAESDHQDTVVQLMLGGRTRNAVIDWLENLDKELSKTSTPHNYLLARSKL